MNGFKTAVAFGVPATETTPRVTLLPAGMGNSTLSADTYLSGALSVLGNYWLGTLYLDTPAIILGVLGQIIFYMEQWLIIVGIGTRVGDTETSRARSIQTLNSPTNKL